MISCEDLVLKREKLSLIGLGYVGMPIAVAFSNKVDVIGFDLNKEKLEQYKNGIDPTREVGNEVIKNSKVEFTSKPEDLKKAKFHIVAVPTPVNRDHTPDLQPIKSACVFLGDNLVVGSIIVFESTVYPGVTEEICIPILEQRSGLRCGVDFKVGYSPERINPGDKVHRLESIIKIVSGMDEESLNTIADVYSLVVEAGIYRATSIKVAEAAKVIENSQRDINIAFMNELSMIFHRMGIDTKDVLSAAGTKWNFLNFSPGLVGGHCIGVDPYYLTYKAEELGYHSQIILSGRRINDEMGKYVAESLVKSLISADITVKNANVAILGFTFKEDCPDIRNTKVIDIYNELKEYGINPIVFDPIAESDEMSKVGIEYASSMTELKNMDSVVIAVSHTLFRDLSHNMLFDLYKQDHAKKILFDLKGVFDKNNFDKEKFLYWSL